VARYAYAPLTWFASASYRPSKAKASKEFEIAPSVVVTLSTGDDDTDDVGERSLPMAERIDALRTISNILRKHVEEDRADRFDAHISYFLMLCKEISEEYAIEYDIMTRRAGFANPRHDFAQPDRTIMTLVDSRINKRERERMFSCMRSMQSVGYSGATSSSKRTAPDFDTRPAKKPRSESCCFRCGFTGHLPEACTAEKTRCGHPCAKLIKSSKSGNALAAPGGQAYCFAFARGTCQRPACGYIHGCSICGDKSGRHGAGRCQA
jgi:hypothetical protein